ncbi:MAG: DNA topoisomerase (ATP-hydrolyzing) [Candidatus Altiarchaeota archaeon]
MAEEIKDRVIDAEMSKSYITYAMSVIVGRALPDVRDGLKPVHRRILYGMRDLDNTPDKPYKKSARVVGEVMGKYHPHGDSAIYETMVRMAQVFSLRYPLVDGQGNFGSIDGDRAAAMRYTEVRLSKIALTVLGDLDKDTVDWVDNFDGSLKEPRVMPSALPNLLVNGSSGIAVGMATNIPPHNLGEIVDACIAVIDEPTIDAFGLLEYLPGPDFPTGGLILGTSGIKMAYATGRGSIKMRAKTSVEEVAGRDRIIVSEIPYMVNKSNLLETIADLVRDKRVDGISDLRDESDKDGIRVVIELKKDASSDVVLNQLFKHSQLQSNFGVINLALVDGQPVVLNLKQTLDEFLKFRLEVVTKRSRFELAKAQARAHILEGLKIAISNLDAVVKLIRAAKDPPTAEAQLKSKFKLSEEQAKAILNMRLSQLTRLSMDKLNEEFESLKKLISYLKDLLSSDEKIMGVVKDELIELKKTFGDGRRTQIVEGCGGS